MKKIIISILVLVMLTACSKAVDDENDSIVIVNNDSSSYNFVKPLQTSYIRFEHSNKDYMEIGQGLLEISKPYFSTSTYAIKEGSYISNFSNDYQPLVLLRESNENPYGLNPARDTVVKVNPTTDVSGPIFVNDIYETNFVHKNNHDELGGMSLALVLNKTLYQDGVPITVDDKVLYEFATEIAGPKLESYLRKKADLANVPIVIAVYVIDKANDSVPGNFIAEAKFENRQGQFSAINQEWAIFPTNSGKKVDSAIDSQVLTLKRSVEQWLPEDIGVVAYGEYINKQLNMLKIAVNVQTKTFTEISALSNHIGESIKNFDTNAPIRVEIKSMNKTLVVIVKNANSNNVEIITL